MTFRWKLCERNRPVIGVPLQNNEGCSKVEIINKNITEMFSFLMGDTV